MPRPLKVLFLLEDLCYGGTQKQSLALATRIDRSRFEPLILTLTGPTDLDSTAMEAGIPIFHMGHGRKVAPLFFGKLPRFIASLKPDIMVPCTALPNIWGRIWGRLLGVPVIIGTCRGGGALARQHEFLLSRLTHGMVCNSMPLHKALLKRGYPQERLRYIANGVDTEHFKPASQRSGQQIVCVARLAADKDHKTLIKAFARVARKFPEAELVLVGEGIEEDELRRWASTYLEGKVASRVRFTGAAADPAPYLSKAVVFALSSIREAQPNAVLEAMACGLPICATGAGGLPDLVQDNGLISRVGDEEALAGNLAKLLGNPDYALELGKKGRERVEAEFSFDRMVAEHQNFFEQLWRQRGGSQ